MDKAKQIEEMVDDLMACHTEFYDNAEIYTDYYDMARNLIAKGYRKQSENIIELPCKVGDRMYVKYKGIVYPVRVDAIRIDTKKNNHRICVRGTFHLYNDYSHEYKATFPFESIGKSLFYTNSEAKGGLYGQISI